MSKEKLPKYDLLMNEVFSSKFKSGMVSVPFSREELEKLNKKLKIKNLGDAIYSARYRKGLHGHIQETTPEGLKWVIIGKGDSKYAFELAEESNIIPHRSLEPAKIPDSTPEIVRIWPESDEQATLARVRYNRLVDLFLGINAYSLQNHLRTNIAQVGQIEVDELYVGVSRDGTQHVIPVQAKGHNDRIGVVQALQDQELCNIRYPQLVPHTLAVFRMGTEILALIEIFVYKSEDVWKVRTRREQHFELIQSDAILREDLVNLKRLWKTDY